MGIWEAWNSSADAIKGNCPDLRTPVMKAWWSSYDVGCSAVKAVKGNGVEKVKEYMLSGPELQKTIASYINHRATREGVKLCFPAGIPALNLVEALLYQPGAHSMHDDKISKEMQRLRADNERLRAENDRLHAENERIVRLTLAALVSKRPSSPFHGSLLSDNTTQIFTEPESLVTDSYSPQMDSSQQ